MKTFQDILNEIGIEQLKIAIDNENYTPLKQFGENQLYQLEAANSNISYEQANKLLEYNGDDTIRFDEILTYINRRIHCVGKCMSKLFITKDRFRKVNKQGRYRKLDVIFQTKLLLNRK